MAFDKEAYWENRKAGIRGQGVIPEPEHIERETDENGQWISNKQPGKYALRKNTKRARKI